MWPRKWPGHPLPSTAASTSAARKALVAAAVVVGLVLLGVAFLRPAGGGAGGAGAQPGQTAPLFASTNLSGQPVVLRADRGHRVILNFWASWCIPCRAEFPVLKQLEAAHPDVIVLGVVFDDNDTSATGFMRSEGATWPGVRDPRAQISDAYGVHSKPGIPVSVLIAPDGRIRDRIYGGLADLTAADAFINEAPAT
jgi:cytochrome c biogenesis protein CcmG, thiol:disulfide interchange protein DsbE